MDGSFPTLRLADLFACGREALVARYGSRLSDAQRKAMAAILACRSGQLGSVDWTCPDCEQTLQTPRSCGHRSCPACQNHTTTTWLDRQRNALLPVQYFMVTFTLPAQLRPLAQARPREVYSILFAAASATIAGFGRHKLKGQLGQCAVLHTHSRRLDLHPHVHVVVPGCSIDLDLRRWRALKGRYLFNAKSLARVFRAKLLHALAEQGLAVPAGMPDTWVVDCRRVGRGEPALAYLSRYLYRGVIRERDLLSYCPHSGKVCFRYIDAKTRRPAFRTLDLVDFLWQVLLHVLPSGFCRARHYGFLHGKAKARLAQLQLLLRVSLAAASPKPRPPVCCPRCTAGMQVSAVRPAKRPDG